MRKAVLLSCVVCGLLTATAGAEVRYKVTNLTEIWMSEIAVPDHIEGIYGSQLNNKGQIAGNYTTSLGGYHAFIWDPNNGLKDLGNLGQAFSFSYSINNSGQVVGQSKLDAISSGDSHAFLWDNATGMRDLGSLGGESYANDINDRGQVVGAGWYDEDTGDEYSHTFLWTEGAGMQCIGAEGEIYSAASKINNVGQITGLIEMPDESLCCVMWDSDGKIHNLGTIGAPTDINDNGLIIAEGQGGVYTTLMIWSEKTGWRDLGTLADGSTFGSSLNNHNQIVGSAWINESYNGDDTELLAMRAFLWEENSGMRNINDLIPLDSPWVITSASAINDNGSILAHEYRNETLTTLLLTPVPEPMAAFMLFAMLQSVVAFKYIMRYCSP